MARHAWGGPGGEAKASTWRWGKSPLSEAAGKVARHSLSHEGGWHLPPAAALPLTCSILRPMPAASCRAATEHMRRATHHFTVEGKDPWVSIFRKFFIESLHKAFEVFLTAVLHVLLRAERGRPVRLVGSGRTGKGQAGARRCLGDTPPFQGHTRGTQMKGQGRGGRGSSAGCPSFPARPGVLPRQGGPKQGLRDLPWRPDSRWSRWPPSSMCTESPSRRPLEGRGRSGPGLPEAHPMPPMHNGGPRRARTGFPQRRGGSRESGISTSSLGVLRGGSPRFRRSRPQW